MHSCPTSGPHEKSWLALVPTVLGLLISAGVILGAAYAQTWTIREMCILYWMEIVLIGFFRVLEILSLREFSPETSWTDNPRRKRLPGNRATKIQAALFFCVHYGLGAIGAGSVVLSKTAYGWVFPNSVNEVVNIMEGLSTRTLHSWLICVASLVISHAVAFIRHVAELRARKPKLRGLMWSPYIRIFAIYLVLQGIVYSSMDAFWGVAAFLGIKTCVDTLAHAIEHAKSEDLDRSETPVEK